MYQQGRLDGEWLKGVPDVPSDESIVLRDDMEVHRDEHECLLRAGLVRRRELVLREVDLGVRDFIVRNARPASTWNRGRRRGEDHLRAEEEYGGDGEAHRRGKGGEGEIVRGRS